MLDIGIITLKEAYQMRVALNNMIEKHEKAALHDLNQGKPHPDFALKAGNKKRSWTDTDKLVQTLRGNGYESEHIYDIKIKGIPAIEKLIKGTEIEIDEFIETSRNKSTLIYTGEK